MNKVFLAVASMIFTGFLMKSYRKLHEKPESKYDIYRRMKAEWEQRKRAEHDAIQAHLMQNKIMAVSTPRDGNMLMNAIGTVGDLKPVMGGY